MNDLPARLLLAAALAATSLAAGCALPVEGRKAPPVQGSAWITPPGKYEFAERYPVRDRWTMVLFFEPNAEACAFVLPEALEILERHAPAGLAAVGVTSADREATEPFVRTYPISFPVLTRAQAVIDSWGVARLVPARVYLVDPEGIIVVQDDLAATADILQRHLRK